MIQTRSGTIGSKTFDPVTRQFNCVVTTQTPVPMTREVDGKTVQVREILLASGCRNLDSVAGAPLIDTHDRSTVDNALGHVISAKNEGNKITAQVQLSERAARFDKDISSGGLNGISAGYGPDYSQDIWIHNPPDGGAPIVISPAWDLGEVSLCAIGADPHAKIRSKGSKMDEDTIKKIVANSISAAIPGIVDAARAASKTTVAAPEPDASDANDAVAAAKAKKAKAAALAAKAKRDAEDDDADDDEDMERATAAQIATRSADDQVALAELQRFAKIRGLKSFGRMVRALAPVDEIAAAVWSIRAPVVAKAVTPPAEFIEAAKGKEPPKLIPFSQRAKPLAPGASGSIDDVIAKAVTAAVRAARG